MKAEPVSTGLDVERQAQALIDLIDADRSHRCEDVLGEANARATAARAEASERARARLREAFAEQRRREQTQLAAALARLATRRRLRDQRRTAALLMLGWQRLPGELRSLWQQRESRAAWARHVLANAAERLPGGRWRVVHAPGWPLEEQQALAQSLPVDPGRELRFEVDPSIEAGVRIVAGSNVLDGTIGGLLADRAEIEARLLQRLAPVRAAEGPT